MASLIDELISVLGAENEEYKELTRISLRRRQSLSKRTLTDFVKLLRKSRSTPVRLLIWKKRGKVLPRILRWY